MEEYGGSFAYSSGGKNAIIGEAYGGIGTSYSGGTGTQGRSVANKKVETNISGVENGGAGGSRTTTDYHDGGGTGNPGGTGTVNGSNGTGGLLIIYGDTIINNGTICSNGSNGGGGNGSSGVAFTGGGGSGGGSINIFCKNQFTGNVAVATGGIGGNGFFMKSPYTWYCDGSDGSDGGDGCVAPYVQIN